MLAPLKRSAARRAGAGYDDRVNSRVFFLFVSPVILGFGLLALIHAIPRIGGPALFWDDDVREEVQGIVGDRYLDPIDAERERELFDAAMQGYVSELDPFSRYFDADAKRELDDETSGTFAGIGVRILPAEGGILVLGVVRGGPAARAGLLPGDLIVRVGEFSVLESPATEVVTHVRGTPGTSIDIGIRRGGAEEQTIPVQRGVVDIDTVPAVRMLDADAFGYLRLDQFSEGTPGEMRQHVHALVREQGARGVVLDLRGNLGGVVRAAVQVAGLFLPPGTVVCSTRSRDGISTYRVQEEPGAGAFADIALVVLVDGVTASASEILAGALQDHGRAVLVGERTYGKFLVQKLVPLSTTKGLVRLTTARYETPIGRSAHRNLAGGIRGGLLPDVVVRLDEAARRSLRIAFDGQIGPRWEVLDGRSGDVPMDGQLEIALSLLRGEQPPEEDVPPETPERG